MAPLDIQGKIKCFLSNNCHSRPIRENSGCKPNCNLLSIFQTLVVVWIKGHQHHFNSRYRKKKDFFSFKDVMVCDSRTS